MQGKCAPAPGDLVDGRYLLGRKLGTGGCADVYEANNVRLGKRVAIKLLNSRHQGDRVSRARFEAEARAMAGICSAHVVDVYDVGETRGGALYMVMELLEGETLEHLIWHQHALPVDYACELVQQVLAGLGAAHQHHIVHRDLKPANVIVTYPRPDRALVKILDFGVAKGVFASGGGTSEDGEVLGTPTYMAPEQALDRDVDPRADVYAAGVILYEMLVGTPPFSGGNPYEILSRVLTHEVVPVVRERPDVGQELSDVIEVAMNRDPLRRFDGVDAFGNALRRIAPSAGFTSIGPDGQSLIPTPRGFHRPTAPDVVITSPGVDLRAALRSVPRLELVTQPELSLRSTLFTNG